jgi:hypothetical protein
MSPDAPNGRVAPNGRAGGRRAAPSGNESWRTYLLVGTLIVLVAAGVGGALWKTGWLNAPDVPRVSPRSAAAAPAAPPADQPGASASSTADAPAVVVDPGAGSFVAAGSEGPILGTAGTLRRFRIEVENGINENPDAFASTVDQILGDQRSWIASGQFRLQRVPPSAPAEFTITLASPTTSEAMCAKGGLHTNKFTSCRLSGQVIINDARWLTAIPDYGAPLQVYRTYAINHEVGHQLGHGHEACLGQGKLAPVMQQQTYGLKGCLANPWPFVDGRRYFGPPIP